jgi:integrase
MRTLRVVWNHALDRVEELPANPVRVLRRKGWFRPAPRTRSVLLEDLERFYAANDALPNRTASDYNKLILFTGLRRREAAALRWDEVDFAARVIRLPQERVKGKRKLDLPMSSVVRDLLIARRAIGNDNGWVFGANSASGHIEEPKFALQQIAAATGIRVSPHDLRRTFITIAEAADVSPLALKRARQSRTRQRRHERLRANDGRTPPRARAEGVRSNDRVVRHRAPGRHRSDR